MATATLQGKAARTDGGRRRLPRELQHYQELGLSLIPINLHRKSPPVRWTRYRHTKASGETIRRWYGKGYGFGVIFGAPSNNLISRDFDSMQSYDEWAMAHPRLAKELPTVKTRRGMHVYATACPDNVREARKALNRPAGGTGAIKVNDGELRPGPGCFSVLPPSKHPSGCNYLWVVNFHGGFPDIDLFDSGFFQVPQKVTELTEAIGSSVMAMWFSGLGETGKPLDARILDATLATLPLKPGERNYQIFRFARLLKGDPSLRDVDPIELKEHVRHWHQLALPVITTKAFSETLEDFCRAWESVQFPGGDDPLRVMLQNVRYRPLHPIAADLQSDEIGELAGLCWELQSAAGQGKDFFLAVRTVGRLFNVSAMTGGKWLNLLRRFGIIQATEIGNQRTMKATRYRYTGADPVQAESCVPPASVTFRDRTHYQGHR